MEQRARFSLFTASMFRCVCIHPLREVSWRWTRRRSFLPYSPFRRPPICHHLTPRWTTFLTATRRRRKILRTTQKTPHNTLVHRTAGRRSAFRYGERIPSDTRCLALLCTFRQFRVIPTPYAPTARRQRRLFGDGRKLERSSASECHPTLLFTSPTVSLWNRQISRKTQDYTAGTCLSQTAVTQQKDESDEMKSQGLCCKKKQNCPGNRANESLVECLQSYDRSELKRREWGSMVLPRSCQLHDPHCPAFIMKRELWLGKELRTSHNAWKFVLFTHKTDSIRLPKKRRELTLGCYGLNYNGVSWL